MKVIINEEQERYLIGMLLNEEQTYTVEPEKVLLVKKYLDKNFVKGNYSEMVGNGDIKNTPIAGRMNPDTKKIEGNFYKGQIFDKLESEFKNIYSDKVKRTKFLKQVIHDWFNGKITKEGLLSVNRF